MKKLNAEQIVFVSRIETSIQKLDKLVTEAQVLNLKILECQLDMMRFDLRNALLFQLRAFRDDSLTDPEPLFPKGRFPYGR